MVVTAAVKHVDRHLAIVCEDSHACYVSLVVLT